MRVTQMQNAGREQRAQFAGVVPVNLARTQLARSRADQQCECGP